MSYKYLLLSVVLFTGCEAEDDGVDHSLCAPPGETANLIDIEFANGYREEVAFDVRDGMVLTEYDIALGTYSDDPNNPIGQKPFSPFFELSLHEKIRELISHITPAKTQQKIKRDFIKSLPLDESKARKLFKKYRKPIERALDNFEDVHKPEQIFAQEDIMGLGRIGRNWPNGVMYYKISPALQNPGRVRTAIKRAQNTLQGIITFVERTNEPNYVEFIESTGCWSYVGMTGGRQPIGLSFGCGANETVHEIGHALGLWHEQSRADRNDFVEVRWCNIKEQTKSNFKQQLVNTIDLGEYDYNSIMHYFANAFSKNGKATLKSKTGTRVRRGNGSNFSGTDIESIRCLYQKDRCNL